MRDTMRLLVIILMVVIMIVTTAGSNSNNTVHPIARPLTATQRRHHQHHHQHRQHHNSQQRMLHQRQARRLQNNEDLKTAQHPDEQVELLPSDNAKKHLQVAQQNATSTRLRRLSARDYYNKNVQHRRQNTQTKLHGGLPEWAYNTYNVQTNTYGIPSSSSSGKGDDNTQDVEFISSNSNSNPEWSFSNHNPRRGYDYVPPPPLVPSSTQAPPARRSAPGLVPSRRAYTTTTTTTVAPTAAPNNENDMPHTTEDPFETNTIGRNSPVDPSEMEKRHICVQHRTITMPVKTTEVYTRPTWKHVNTPCPMPTHANQMCTRVQLVHEQAYRDVIRQKSAQQVTYDCCTGWTRETPYHDACMKPICTGRCQNGGTCSGPDTCTCASGFTGHFCEHDINECKEEKPCDQTCINTVGSYYCKCREGFVLQADQQSCKKIDIHADDAFEARDLENEIESDSDVAARLQKIERSLANERVQTNELQKTLQATYNVVDTLKGRLSTLEKQQHDLTRLQSNLYATETRTNKLEGMVNLLMKCRNAPNAYCP